MVPLEDLQAGELALLGDDGVALGEAPVHGGEGGLLQGVADHQIMPRYDN